MLHSFRQGNLLLVLVVLLSLGSSCSATTSSDCQVLNALGEDVTATMVVNTGNNGGDGADTTDHPSHVLCQEDRPCQNYTITNCPAVQCIGKEVCFQTNMTNIGRLVECHEMHSCHRAIVHFSEDNTDDNTIQSMTCQGEGACNVAEIRGSQLQLECFGRKSCRKINAKVNSVHCTHGEEYCEACVDYARLQANCVLCGYLGCESHVNHCGTKPLEAPDDQRYTACIPHQAIGTGCTPQQIQALENEIATDGQMMGSQELETVQEETINDNGGSN